MNQVTPIVQAPAEPPANLSDFIVAEVARQCASDNVRKLVEAKIDESIRGAVNDAFRSYGDVRQHLEKAVKDALQIGERRLDVPSYGNMVMAILRTKMDEVLQPLVSERLAKEMDDILGLAPKELKLSKVVEAMIQQEKEIGAERWGGRVTCLVEGTNYGGHWIYLDRQSDAQRRSKHECTAQVGVNDDGNIFYLKIDRKDARTTVVMGEHDPYLRMLFAAYCCGSKFIVDEEDVSTTVGDF